MLLNFKNVINFVVLICLAMDFTCKPVLKGQQQSARLLVQQCVLCSDRYGKLSEKRSSERGSRLFTGCYNSTNKALNTKQPDLALISFSSKF